MDGIEGEDIVDGTGREDSVLEVAASAAADGATTTDSQRVVTMIRSSVQEKITMYEKMTEDTRDDQTTTAVTMVTMTITDHSTVETMKVEVAAMVPDLTATPTMVVAELILAPATMVTVLVPLSLTVASIPLIVASIHLTVAAKGTNGTEGSVLGTVRVGVD